MEPFTSWKDIMLTPISLFLSAVVTSCVALGELPATLVPLDGKGKKNKKEKVRLLVIKAHVPLAVMEITSYPLFWSSFQFFSWFRFMWQCLFCTHHRGHGQVAEHTLSKLVSIGEMLLFFGNDKVCCATGPQCMGAYF